MNKFIEFILFRLSHIGEIPLCNGISSRAPHIFGFCFPLCYRCTFIIIGFLITLWIFSQRKIKIHWMILILCMLPMLIDGSIQTFLGVISTNLRRTITGGMFGFGLGAGLSQLYGKLC